MNRENFETILLILRSPGAFDHVLTWALIIAASAIGGGLGCLMGLIVR